MLFISGIISISLRWGGTYSYKIDGMHFEIPKMININEKDTYGKKEIFYIVVGIIVFR